VPGDKYARLSSSPQPVITAFIVHEPLLANLANRPPIPDSQMFSQLRDLPRADLPDLLKSTLLAQLRGFHPLSLKSPPYRYFLPIQRAGMPPCFPLGHPPGRLCKCRALALTELPNLPHCHGFPLVYPLAAFDLSVIPCPKRPFRDHCRRIPRKSESRLQRSPLIFLSKGQSIFSMVPPKVSVPHLFRHLRVPSVPLSRRSRWTDFSLFCLRRIDSKSSVFLAQARRR